MHDESRRAVVRAIPKSKLVQAFLTCLQADLHLRRNAAQHGQAAALDGDPAAGGVHAGAGPAVQVPWLFS